MNDQENNFNEDRPIDAFVEEGKQAPPKKHKAKRSDDFLGSLTWALILIWAGLVFLAANFGWLARLHVEPIEFGGITIVGVSTWSVVFLGAGVLVFFEALLRSFLPAYRRSSGGNYFLAAILLGVGLGGIIGWAIVWPFILIGMGLAALASALF